jgi:hypothetical protein
MKDKATPISEAVNFLNRIAPDRLLQLREVMPEALRPELQPGGVLGVERPSLLQARCDVMIEALQQMVLAGRRAITQCSANLRTARNWRFASEIVSTVSSASVVTCLSLSKGVLAMVSGVLALVGSFAVLFADHAIKLPTGGNDSLYTVYTKLMDIVYAAEATERELRVLRNLGDEERDKARLESLVTEANRLCEQINALRTPLLPRATSP